MLGLDGAVAASTAAIMLGAAARVAWRRGRSSRTGPWDVLLELARGRTAVRAEQERRETIADVVERLPQGGRVVEVDRQGQRRSYEVSPRNGVQR
jgi:hypothetical protein